MSPVGRRPRVAFVNLGCRVNRVEIDDIALELEGHGCVRADEESADLVVVNTCAVTGEAEKKARKAVRHAAGLPTRPLVIATGCVVSLFAEEMAGLGGNVIAEPDKSKVASRALDELGVDPGAHPACAESRTPTGRMRPGVKVQDGCDNRCAYCIVWKARGPARSEEPGEVVARVRGLVEAGAGEVVLSGIDLGRYHGRSAAGGELDLAGLLSRLLDETDVGRVRLSSVEPGEVTPGLLDVMAASGGRVAPFLHLPLQSGCDETLLRMGRAYGTSLYQGVVEAARKAVPGVAIACDLIVGFPGETDEEFSRSLEFCRGTGFAKMHVFRYSRRPGTPAATLPDQVPAEVSSERGASMREMASASRLAYAASRIGREELVFVEREGRGVTGGLVDALVDSGRPGEFVRARPRRLVCGALDARVGEGAG